MPDGLRVGLDSLTPPSGGWGRLRRRIEADRIRRARGRRMRAATAVLVVVGALGWAGLRRGVAPRVASVDLGRAGIGVNQLELPTEPLTLPESARASTAIQRVDLPTDEVVFYLVGFVQD